VGVVAEEAAAEAEWVEEHRAGWAVADGMKVWPENMAERSLNPLNYGQKYSWRKFDSKLIKESKMTKLRILVVAFGIAILFAGTLALKANAFGPPHQKGGFHGLRALMDLDLSASQKAEVRDIIGEHREKGKEIRIQLFEAREKSMDEIETEPFDEEKVRQAFQRITPLLEEAAVLKARLMADIRSVLNPDQLELLKQRRSEHSERMKKDMRFRESMMDTWLQMDTE
jgi:Spy/CpxP family protein refolding chaperone